MFVVIQDESLSYRELSVGRGFADNSGVSHGWNVVELWPDEALAKLKIYKVTEPVAPEGMEADSSTLRTFREVNGKPEVVIAWRPISKTGPKPEELVEAPVIPAPAPVLKPLAPVLTIEQERVVGLDALNREVTKKRAEYSTLVVHQGPIYAIKKDEAERFLASPTSDLTAYPFLKAALNTRTDGQTAQQIAEVWKAKSARWMIVSADLEAKRLVAKRAIEKATDTDTIDEAIRTFLT